MSQSQSTQEQPVGMGFLRRLVAYAEEVYGLKKLLDEFSDGRRDPRVPPSVVAAVVLFCGLLRIRSFNALEPKLAKASFQRLVDQPMPKVDGVVQKLCSVDTLGRALCVADLTKARAISWGILSKAERNKVFREGWVGALRYFAIDGWEPFCSCERCCDHCLIRKVKVEREGQVIEVDQYYHRYVVAMLVDERLDLVLDFEPLLPSDLRPDKSDKHEGEQTAALRLLPRLKKKFAWLDAVIADALFANGPFLTAVEALRMSALIVAKKSGEEPLRSFGRDRGKDVTKTISALVDELLDDLATLTTSPWSTAT